MNHLRSFAAIVVMALILVLTAPASGFARTAPGIKLQQSESVVNWYRHRGHWTLYPAQKTCYSVVLFQERMRCVVARRNLRWHEQRIGRMQGLIEARQFATADSSIYLANHFAAQLFGVRESLLDEIVGGEGGNVSSQTLSVTLCSGEQPGWNDKGSDAFGPYQFMLDHKPACSDGWGTFGNNDDAAFAAAARRGVVIPARYDTPASNLGQAITGAYMVLTGGITPWCASMC